MKDLQNLARNKIRIEEELAQFPPIETILREIIEENKDTILFKDTIRFSDTKLREKEESNSTPIQFLGE